MHIAREDHRRQADRRKRRIARLKARGVDLEDDDHEPPSGFDEQGGVGYDARRDPSPNCQECWGEGRVTTVVADTRKLDAEAAVVYAGMKETKDGLQVLMESRTDALELLGKHLGMFKDRIEHTGPEGGAIQVVTGVPASPEK